MKDQSPNCPLFRLPGELRNRIYELVFEISSEDTILIADAFSPPNQSDTDAARLLPRPSSAPPPTALIRSCQHIHGESKVFFDEASERYWKQEFSIELPKPTPHHLTFESFIEPVPTQRIENLSVMVSSLDGTTTKVGLCRGEKGWDIRHPTHRTLQSDSSGPLKGPYAIYAIQLAALLFAER